jgi:hypothetical protein
VAAAGCCARAAPAAIMLPNITIKLTYREAFISSSFAEGKPKHLVDLQPSTQAKLPAC